MNESYLLTPGGHFASLNGNHARQSLVEIHLNGGKLQAYRELPSELLFRCTRIHGPNEPEIRFLTSFRWRCCMFRSVSRVLRPTENPLHDVKAVGLERRATVPPMHHIFGLRRRGRHPSVPQDFPICQGQRPRHSPPSVDPAGRRRWAAAENERPHEHFKAL